MDLKLLTLIILILVLTVITVSAKKSDTDSYDIDPALYENEDNKNDIKLIIKFFKTISNEIYPLTKEQVSKGDRVFGGAVFFNSSQDNYPLINIGTNRAFTNNALWHGEISVITNYWNLWNGIGDDFTFNKEYFNDEPNIEDTIFLATHEPCSYCLSAISWNGFKHFYFLFSYEETENDFEMPGDILMHNEVFNNFGTETDPYYNEKNVFWNSRYIVDMIREIENAEIREILTNQYNHIKAIYVQLMDENPGCNKELVHHGQHSHQRVEDIMDAYGIWQEEKL